MKNYWWKALAIVLVLYTIVAGFLFKVPALPVLNESIRNLYFHVPMWFAMMAILFVSLWFSVKYLSKSNIQDDIVANQAAQIGMLAGTLGLLTGSVWAKHTWLAWWVPDPKLNGSAIWMKNRRKHEFQQFTTFSHL